MSITTASATTTATAAATNATSTVPSIATKEEAKAKPAAATAAATAAAPTQPHYRTVRFFEPKVEYETYESLLVTDSKRIFSRETPFPAPDLETTKEMICAVLRYFKNRINPTVKLRWHETDGYVDFHTRLETSTMPEHLQRWSVGIRWACRVPPSNVGDISKRVAPYTAVENGGLHKRIGMTTFEQLMTAVRFVLSKS